MPELPPLVCGGCRTCCTGDTIVLQPEDALLNLRTVTIDGAQILAKGLDGNCVYLGPVGCTIQGAKPAMCRAFDCRLYYLRYEHDDAGLMARLQGPMRNTVLEGRRRVAKERATQGARIG